MNHYPMATVHFFSRSLIELEEVSKQIADIIRISPHIRCTGDFEKTNCQLDIDCYRNEHNPFYFSLSIFPVGGAGEVNAQTLESTLVFCKEILNRKLCHSFNIIELVTKVNFFKKKKLVQVIYLYGSNDACMLSACILKRIVDITKIDFSKSCLNFDDGIIKRYEYQSLANSISYDDRFQELINFYPYTNHRRMGSTIYSITN